MHVAELLKRPYSRVVVPEPDGTFRAEIMEFPGCIATGGTASEALSKLEDVAESWLESVLARGTSVPEPLEENDYSGRLVLRLPKGLHQRAALWAERESVSLNQFILTCVAEHVGARTGLSAQMKFLNFTSPATNVLVHSYRAALVSIRTPVKEADMNIGSQLLALTH